MSILWDSQHLMVNPNPSSMRDLLGLRRRTTYAEPTRKALMEANYLANNLRVCERDVFCFWPKNCDSLRHDYPYKCKGCYYFNYRQRATRY